MGASKVSTSITTASHLRVLFFQDGKDPTGNYYKNSPGLLPMIEDVRRRGFDLRFYVDEAFFLKACLDPCVDVVALSTVERKLVATVELARKIRATGYAGVLMIGGKTISAYIEKLVSAVFDIAVGEEGELIFPALLYSLAAWKGKSPSADLQSARRLYPSRIIRVGQGEPGGAIDDTGLVHLSASSFGRADCIVGISQTCIRNGETGEVFRMEPPVADSFEKDPGLDCLPDQAELQNRFAVPIDLLREHGWQTLELYTQRGCPWAHCIFCSIPRTRIRSLSYENILEAVNIAAGLGIRNISFADDMFIQDSAWSQGLLVRLMKAEAGMRYRAQTCPTRAVWKHLELLAEAGFDELFYGVETLVESRAEFLRKTCNGRTYVENARKTILRTAAVGILPVMYMILLDPRSTLAEVACDLLACTELISSVYTQTRLLTKLSWSLVLLPVSNGMLGGEYSLTNVQVDLGKWSFDVPSEYNMPEILVLLVQKIVQMTAGLPCSRDSFETLGGILLATRDISRQYEHQSALRTTLEALEIYEHLKNSLLADIRETAQEVLQVSIDPRTDWWRDPAMRRFNYLRFASFIEGMQVYADLLQGEKTSMHN